MPISISKKSLISALISVLLVSLMMAVPSIVSAQSDGSDFQITSSKSISALEGESFTYFVVTNTDTSVQLLSELPSGLTYSNNQISGTPQETGNFTLEFSGSDTEDTESVNLTVLSATSDQQQSTGGGTTEDSTDSNQNTSGQLAQSEEGVGLNDIPDTGMSADRALTLAFYVLALLFLTQIAVRKLFARTTVSQDVGNTRSEADSEAVRSSNQFDRKEKASDDGRSEQIGDGIKSQ
jgi:hypothetical protein